MCYCHHVIQLAAALSNTDASDIALHKNICIKHTAGSRSTQASSWLLKILLQTDFANKQLSVLVVIWFFIQYSSDKYSSQSAKHFHTSIHALIVWILLVKSSVVHYHVNGYEVNQWSFKDDLISLSCHIFITSLLTF
jgi:hypothetical protein